MTSVHAVRAVFTALAGVAGVSSADVSLGSALVEHNEGATIAALREAIAVAGCEMTRATVAKRQLPLL
ncbi:MAG: heavy-metal-associated domain-containing protein [Gemmatimonadaceae bacterium]